MTPEPRYRPPDTPEALVLAWLRRAREAQMAHYEMADILGRRSRWLGVPVILITAIVGTSIFASIAAEVVPAEAKIVVGLLSVLAAVLSSLQTFFKYAERAEGHRSFAARFGAVRRELEVLYADHAAAQESHYLAVLREKLDKLADEAPNVPPAVFHRVQKTALAFEQTTAP